MKNLTIISILLLLLSFVACKKQKSAPPEEQIDFTQYCIVEKAKTLSVTDPVMHTLIAFNAEGKCDILSLRGGYTYDYNYANGILKIVRPNTGGVRSEYKIENKVIVSYSGSDESFKPQLIKVPNSNQFSGNRYYGSWKADGGAIIQPANLKFTDNQFGETSINEPFPNKNYTLIKNIAATNVENGIMNFWVLVDGKLEATRYNANTTAKWYTGIFTKQ